MYNIRLWQNFTAIRQIRSDLRTVIYGDCDHEFYESAMVNYSITSNLCDPLLWYFG